MKKTLLQIIALFCIELIIILPLYTVNALTISDVQVTDITENSATVSWVTDQHATGRVKYGLTPSLGLIKTHSNFLQEHNLPLTGLSSETKYYFDVASFNVTGDLAVDNNSDQLYSFTTLDVIPPEKVTGLRIEDVTINSIIIAWDNVPSSDLSHYNIYRYRIKIANTTQTTFQDVNLSPSTFYDYKVSAVDLSGNEGDLSNTLAVQTEDIILPVISSLEVTEITDTTAAINWNTDKNSTSMVYYGINETLNKFEEDKSLVKSHAVTITQLLKGQEYSFIAGSCDENNICVNSTKQSFKAGRDTTPPPLNVVIPEFVNAGTINIIGTTEPFSDVKLFVNNLNLPVRFLDSSRVSTGAFQFFDIVLERENIIKITAKDKAGNGNEKVFRVSVDTEDPEVILEEIPSVTKKENISIIGIVNEPVTINIFLTQNADFTIPEKITGLNATAGNNSVELVWDETEAKGFSHYAIYRNDVPIATTQPESYNTFIDILVNSESTYTYQVTAITVSGKESPKSNPAIVTIPAGGKKGISEPEAIDILQEVKQPVLSINATRDFSETIELVDDGVYGLIIKFIDRAKNTVVVEKEITLDTKPPTIEIISPPKGTNIYENYADEVDIEGKTEPNAEVHLFVQRTPLGFLNKTFDVSGLPDQIQGLTEADLRADCRFAVGVTEFCSTGADFSTTADDEGYFFFDDVDLTSVFAVGISIRQEPLTEFSRGAELRESKTSSLVFIATDKSGNRGSERVDFGIISCWSGNQTWDIIPLTEFQSPTLISTERLAENNEHIQFFFNYSYQGRGSEGFIPQGGITLSKACQGTEILGEDRFNVSCKVLPEGSASTIVNPEGTISYTTIKLNRIENMDRWLEDDWNDFFDLLGTEITFPFKVRITYKHIVNGREVTETQTTCQEVSYEVDNSRIDPRKVLPDWLLYDFVDFLDESVKRLNEIKQQVDRVLEYVVVGCVGSFLLRLVVQIGRRFNTFLEEKKIIISKASLIEGLQFSFGEGGDEEYCDRVSDNILKEFKEIKLKYYSDQDLRRCFTDVAAWWEAEANLYQAYRFTCDRVFGHETPSKWTETRTDQQLTEKLQTAQGCAIDQAVQGQPLRAVSCREIVKKYKLDPERYTLGEKCFEIFSEDGRKESLYSLDQKVDEAQNIYKLGKITGPSERRIIYAIKQTETSYLTARPETCAEVCGITARGRGGEASEKNVKLGGTYSAVDIDKEGTLWSCTTATQCRAQQGNKIQKDNEEIVVKSAVSRGYSSDCFYQTEDYKKDTRNIPRETQYATSVSDNPNNRYECCCLNAVKGPPTNYYQPQDVNKYKSPDPSYPSNPDRDAYYPAFENKNNPDTHPQKFEDMEWSYRYWKEQYTTLGNTPGDKGVPHFKYNQNRYIEGRDLPACFGQNNWIYDGVSSPETVEEKEELGNLLIIDPAKQHTSAFQCLNIAGISNRITFLNNLMTHLSGCLKQVRTTGTADAGVCKELFTQYVCSSIWSIIQWFTEGCLPFGTGYDFTKSENEISQNIAGGVKSVWGSIADSQQELYDEYGNAQLRNLLGAGEEAIARKICLAAFGYDWEINLQDIIDAAYTQSFASLVQAITGTREFLTIDPQSGKAKYEYRSSWIINTGCEMENYRVELACVGRNQIAQYPGINCKKVQDPGGNNCDCKNLGEEKTQLFYSSRGGLAQNVLEDRDHHNIIDSVYRYDHLKFTLRPDSRIKGDLKESCFPDGHYENGRGIFYFPLRDKTARDILNCQVDITLGLFKCSGAQNFWDRKGRAYFISEKINDQVVGREQIVVKAGDPITLQPTIYKTPDDKVQCLVAEVKKHSGTENFFETIDNPGPQEYFIRLVQNAELTRGREPDIDFQKCEFSEEGENEYPEGPNRRDCNEVFRGKKLKVQVISRGNQQDFTLRFEDRWGSKGKIDLNKDSQDLIYIDDLQGRELRKYWDDSRKAIVIDLEEKGKFRIRSIGFDENIKSIEFTVNIPPATITEERWTISYALYHIKDNETNCRYYNPAEKIKYQGRWQENSATIKVTSEATAANRPVITIDVKSPVELKESKDEIQIDVDITDDEKIKRVKYELIGPNRDSNIGSVDIGQEKDKSTIKCSEGSPDKEKGEADRQECFINIKQEALKNLAGKYEIEIIATDSDNNEAKAARTFQIGCVSAGYDKWGLCTGKVETCSKAIKDDDGTIKTLKLKCADDFKCCLQKVKI